MKARSLTAKSHGILSGWRLGGGTGILSVAVKCVDSEWNTSGEGESLDKT